MNRIRILPDQVANQIAAGEVVERPASVLKELVENAIDAQAATVRVEIRGGGKSLIRVSDSGHGMGRDDALLCLERHATSKIHDSADIGSIHTLGFRGEAIPSIASVSRFRLLTRETDSNIGTEIEIHGGKLIAVKEAGCKVGTEVEVRSLFYNLPARRKFLRSDTTELGHLHHVFLLHAIAQPKIAWTLLQDDRVIYELPPSHHPIPDHHSALLSRIRTLHGSQLATQLLPVKTQRGGIEIHGFVGKPGLSRSNRSELYCFVNSRPVDSRAIYYGLIEAYHTALMRGRYPVCFLFLEIDPALVDVNIHPAKREVRFREDALVQGIVIESVRKALGTSSGTVRPNVHVPMEMTLPEHGMKNSDRPSVDHGQLTMDHSETSHSTLGSQNSPFATRQSLLPIPHAEFPIQNSKFKPPTSSPITLLGVFANLYVIAMDSEGIIMIDQHAAHERILFEQMMSRLNQGKVTSQRLLLPQTVELSPKDTMELKSYISTLEKMGFGIAEFGERSFIVDALPPLLNISSISQLMRSILDELTEAGQNLNRDRFSEEKVAKTVCRHAVKANDILRPEELQRMITDLQACNHPLTCPHGRPTMLRITQPELEKKFGRRPLE